MRTPYQLCEDYRKLMEEAEALGVEGELRDFYYFDFVDVGDFSVAKLARLIELMAENPNIIDAMKLAWANNKHDWCIDAKLEFRQIYKQLKLFHAEAA
jgi:hypothetical protein